MQGAKTKDQLEADKVQAEIDSLKSQVSLNEQSREFKQKDRRWTAWSRWKDLISIVVGVAPMLAVLLAVYTMKASQEKDAAMQKREEKKHIAELAYGLAHNNTAVRIASASSLSLYLDDEEHRETITTALIGALLVEGNVTARGILLENIPGGETVALRQIEAVLPAVRIKLQEYRADIKEHRNMLYQLEREKQSVRIREEEVKLRQIMRELNALQHAVVALVLKSRELISKEDCQKSNFSQSCRVELNDLYLDHYNFATLKLDLSNVCFRNSSLVSAIFTGVTLNGASFSECDLREAHFRDASLVGANFNNARMEWQPDRLGDRPRTYFTGADLTAARFDNACLSGADFRSPKSVLIPEQFAQSFAKGARFDEKLRQSFEKANVLKDGPGCQVKPQL